MATCVSVVLCLAAVAAAQSPSIAPTNATLSSAMTGSESSLKLVTGDQNGQVFDLAPLTANAGLGQSPTAVAVRILPLSASRGTPCQGSFLTRL